MRFILVVFCLAFSSQVNSAGVGVPVFKIELNADIGNDAGRISAGTYYGVISPPTLLQKRYFLEITKEYPQSDEYHELVIQRREIICLQSETESLKAQKSEILVSGSTLIGHFEFPMSVETDLTVNCIVLLGTKNWQN